MDSPEIGQQCTRAGKAFDCGRSAQEHLLQLVSGQTVGCTGWQRDKYDRLLAICKADGVDLNGRMVADGWAVAFGDYEGEEAAAQEHNLGIWQGEFIRPREWRSMHGKLAEIDEQTSDFTLNSLASRILVRIGSWINFGENK
jgi:endonuclease YncB( thermonuclease family)